MDDETAADYDDGLITENPSSTTHQKKDTIKTVDYNLRAKRCSIASLIIGIIITIGFILSYFSPGYTIIVVIYFLGPFMIIGEIISIILTIVTIVSSFKQKKCKPAFIIMTLAGTVLSFSPFIWGIYKDLIKF